ncbi:phosphoinositide phospholipase C 2-like isoform X2 [Jatropha curcas]|uniref:phosphoinositide phospholipase C 2-like isoform X2 n=1 Tax=Jatropha curcas TaxID=180498 RepID=UPI0005FABDD2|nr:phosphoinositide phospholipase C 2-like isoform X2 [Jatropha curcas]
MAVASAPKEIKALFGKYSEDGIMTADHLRLFLVEIQKEDKSTIEESRAIIDQFHDVAKGLSLEGFFKYLFGDNNLALDPKRGQIGTSQYEERRSWTQDFGV